MLTINKNFDLDKVSAFMKEKGFYLKELGFRSDGYLQEIVYSNGSSEIKVDATKDSDYIISKLSETISCE